MSKTNMITNFLSLLYDTGKYIEDEYILIENTDKMKLVLAKYGKTIVRKENNPYELDTDLTHKFMERLVINDTGNINSNVKNYQVLLESYNNSIEKIMNKLIKIDTELFNILFLLNQHTTIKSPITDMYYGKTRDTDVITDIDIMKATNILYDMLQDILDLITPKNIDDIKDLEKDESVFFGYLLSLCETSVDIVTDNLELYDTAYNCVYGLNIISNLLKELLTSRTFNIIQHMVNDKFDELFEYITNFLWLNEEHNLEKYVNKYGNTIKDIFIDSNERNKSVKQLFNFRKKY